MKGLSHHLAWAARVSTAIIGLSVPGFAEAAVVSFIQDHLGGPLAVQIAGFDQRSPSIEPGNCLGSGGPDVAKCASVGDNSYGIWNTATSRAGPRTEYLALLTAPGTATVSAVVSLFWSIDGNLAFLSSYFQADPTDYPTVPTGYFGVTEIGGLQNISDLFPDGGGAAIPLPQGLTIYVQTDAEPAPESALLLASGLMAVGLVRRCARSA